MIANLVYGDHPLDAPTIAIVSSLLIAVAAAACWVPARRASIVQPLAAIRLD
jgi:ABC-type antimicrobial peptide transport system permease subunit